MTDIARWKRRAARKSEVKGRAQEPSHMFKMCRVVGCKKTARAGTGDGLDTRFCRSHADHYARHGSPYHASFKASEINPFRRAAVEWLVVNEGDRVVANALLRVRRLYDQAGPYVEAFRLRGMSPKERAKAAWARLRQHEVDPRMVVAAWLAVEAKTAADPQSETKGEFKRVQAAKIVHRLASGSHKSWPQGGGKTTELHVYPASRGNVLRRLGEDIEQAAELVTERYVKAATETLGMTNRRAAPRHLAVRRRFSKRRSNSSV
ncbi:hypothetical protein [Bradyrhizobium sp. NC92]|uniref:hypothetical protein n=1 Tax=Bradyrhizobium sp. (strain NC92) TaxID=55395 RepID=UPI0021AA4084|nr:hypothetical protein [Bradyrhizobium sp. NC92]UWU65545.1 hypothetical protein N2602_19925 [Bradyrhizobium sp. NC92]